MEHPNFPTIPLEDMMSSENFEILLRESFQERDSLEGEVVSGTVLGIHKEMVIIDVGLKSEGRIPLKEFGDTVLKIGDTIDVYIERYEGRLGDVQLSREKVLQKATWQKLSKAHKDATLIEGTIVGQVKGGLTVSIDGTIAFLPGSQVDVRPVKDLGALVGETRQFMVLKMDEERSNVVVSHRAILEECRTAGKKQLLETLEQGAKLEGVVKNITDYGAFVDLGGIDGLLHVTDIAWRRIQHPSEVLKVGETIMVMVTRFNKETQRISLGRKQLEKDPWQSIHERYTVGSMVMGTVTNVTDYGAFVALSEGVEGLIYMAEMVWSKRNINPHQVVTPNEEVQVMILDIDPGRRRISLGLKQCTKNPFESFEKTYPVGSEVEGEVKNVTEVGLIVQLPGGIDCTIHKADLSWDLSPDEALARYQIDEKIRMRVLSINAVKEMIGLGVKQLAEGRGNDLVSAADAPPAPVPPEGTTEEASV